MRNKNYLFKALSSQSGQLLTEVLVALAVGGILVVAATAGIVSVIKQNHESRSSQNASLIAQDLINKVKTTANSDWHNIYSLSHGSLAKYYIVSSATSSIAVLGQESTLANDIASGLVGYWKFDESGGLVAYDFSGNGNIGNNNTTTVITSENCSMGNCLGFNGTNSMVVSSDVVINPATSDFTAMGWIKVTDYTAVSRDVFSQEDGSGTGRSWLTVASPSGFLSSSIGNVSTFGSTALTPGTWHHGTITKSGTSLKIYLDGTLDGSGTATTESSVGKLRMGMNKATSTNPFYGSLDDMRVYNRALSASEIKQIYENQVFTRYFYIDNVSRDTSGDIQESYSASTDDPSTQKVTAIVNWQDGRTMQLSHYLTRSKNRTFTQDNWSAGSGIDGPVTEIGRGYSSSTNITATTSIEITDRSADGFFYSTTWDTQIILGAAYNALVWHGTKPSGTSVKFQIASSNSLSGTGANPTGAIDSVYRYAWNDEIGWIDFGYASGGVQVQNAQLIGYANNDDVGEISLDCATSPSGNICATSNYKVTRDPSTGDLAGYAWNDVIGWISFNCSNTSSCGTSNYKVTVNTSNGIFEGYAWNDAVGWISFNCSDTGMCGTSDYKVSTTQVGGWVYLGPDCTSLTYYQPNSGSATPISLKCNNNQRYVKYKMVLSPDLGHTLTPIVNDTIINWSP